MAKRKSDDAPPEEQAFRLELLAGSMILDSEGRKVGRVKEVLAHREATDCYIDAILVGPRHRISDVLHILVSALGGHHDPEYRRVSWRDFDFTDPRRPRLRCRLEDLPAE